MPAVSIILPTRDRPDLLSRALDSVFAQTWTDWELILVDGNRAAPPLAAQSDLERYLSDRRVRIVSNPTGETAAAARNVGFPAVRGDWVSYLDDDDSWRPAKLAVQLAATAGGAHPLVLCGYTVHLPRRARTRQIGAACYAGDALLTAADWGAPFLLHRRDDALRFDETLAAGEDMEFAHRLIARHDLRSVPNCAEALVDVYPQIGRPRVHRDGEAIWRAYETVIARVGKRYGKEAQEMFLAKGRLVRAQFGHGGLGEFVALAGGVLRRSGPGGLRLVANAAARRLGWFERWVVN